MFTNLWNNFSPLQGCRMVMYTWKTNAHTHVSCIFARNVGQVFRVNLTFQVVNLFRWSAVSNSGGNMNATEIYSHQKAEDKLMWQLPAHYARDLQSNSWSYFPHVKLNLDFSVIHVKSYLFIPGLCNDCVSNAVHVAWPPGWLPNE
jgi:hypothetical protein